MKEPTIHTGAATAPQTAEKVSVYGVVAEFESPEALLEGVRAARALAYEKMDAFTPFPVHGIDEAMGARRSRLGWIVLIGGIAGAVAAVLLQWWTGAIASPLRVAGKPMFAFEFGLPIIFELAVLLAAFAAVLGMLALNGLPRFYHPVFKHSRFDRAADDRFLLALEANGAGFDAEQAAEILKSAGGRHVEVVTE
ncbi:MAG: DUF3341 domain-containing protein [Rhodospirillales bacterium]